MTPKKPITTSIPRLRQRLRADGTWRLWWEPETDVRALGFAVVELDAGKLGWSVKQCERLNLDVDRARKAGQRTAPTGARSIDALIRDYQGSRKFLGRAEKTQLDYGRRMKAIAQKWGAQPVGAFTKPVMHQWYETLYAQSGAHQALNQLRIMSILFAHAELIGWRPEGSNPCTRLGMQVPKGRSRSATWAEFDALIAAADTLGWPAMACAVALSALQGARQTDVRTARLDGFRTVTLPASGRATQRTALIWELVRSKRGNMGAMELHPDCAPRVRAMLEAAKPGQITLLIDATSGRPISEGLFEDRFSAMRALAAKTVPTVATLQFRDLRRTFGVWSRAGGSSKADVGDVLGNSAATDPKLGETYMPPSFETATRAVMAIARPKTGKRKAG
jgi:integrase